MKYRDLANAIEQLSEFDKDQAVIVRFPDHGKFAPVTALDAMPHKDDRINTVVLLVDMSEVN